LETSLNDSEAELAVAVMNAKTSEQEAAQHAVDIGNILNDLRKLSQGVLKDEVTQEETNELSATLKSVLPPSAEGESNDA
jgi:hypothetical protein